MGCLEEQTAGHMGGSVFKWGRWMGACLQGRVFTPTGPLWKGEGCVVLFPGIKLINSLWSFMNNLALSCTIWSDRDRIYRQDIYIIKYRRQMDKYNCSVSSASSMVFETTSLQVGLVISFSWLPQHCSQCQIQEGLSETQVTLSLVPNAP